MIKNIQYTHLNDYWEHHTNPVFDPLSPSELPLILRGIDSIRKAFFRTVGPYS